MPSVIYFPHMQQYQKFVFQCTYTVYILILTIFTIFFVTFLIFIHLTELHNAYVCLFILSPNTHLYTIFYAYIYIYFLHNNRSSKKTFPLFGHKIQSSLLYDKICIMYSIIAIFMYKKKVLVK